MALGLVQQANNSTNGSTLNVTISAGANGNTIVVFSANVSGTISSISCTNVTFTKLASGGNENTEIWYGTISGGSSGTTVAISYNGGTTRCGATVAEFSGIAATPGDGGAAQAGNGTAITTAAYSNTNANDVILACVGWFANDTVAAQPGGIFSNLTGLAATNASLQANYGVVSSAAARSATWTTNIAANWGSVLGGLKLVANTTTPRTITGIARITATTLKTIAGIARITATTLRTVTGIARITATTLRTLAGVARITASTLRTIPGIARITATVLRTIAGVARITINTSQTIAGIARITATVLRTIPGIARITITTLQTIPGVGRITVTVAQTIAGIAKITATTLQDILGKARITATTLRTITGVANITPPTITTAQTIAGIARITAATLRLILGVGRITATTLRTITGVANIELPHTRQTITGVARIVAFIPPVPPIPYHLQGGGGQDFWQTHDFPVIS